MPALEAEVVVGAEDEVAGLVSVLCYYQQLSSDCSVYMRYWRTLSC